VYFGIANQTLSTKKSENSPTKAEKSTCKNQNFEKLTWANRSKIPSSDEATSILEDNFGGFSLNSLLHERKCKNY